MSDRDDAIKVAKDIVKTEPWATAMYQVSEALLAEVQDGRDNLEEKQRLIRVIDAALHGEEGAAKQASLCDLISSAKAMRNRAETAERECQAQARLNDMGSEREARLMAKVAELELLITKGISSK